MNKSQLLESIRAGHSRFMLVLAEFNHEQMTQPGVIGKWSLRDTVAHIVVHEQRMIRWMQERLHGDEPVLPQPYAMPDDELNQLNEQVYQEQQVRSLCDILHDFDQTHIEALTLVETAAEEDILDPGHFSLQGGEPLWEAIAANTFWHCAEHMQDIHKWQVAACEIAR